MGDILLRKDLEKILNWLIDHLSQEEIEKLKEIDRRRAKRWVSSWASLKKMSRRTWLETFAPSKIYVSLFIQEILDLKAKRAPKEHKYAGGLPKKYMLQLANEVLDLHVSEDKNKYHLRSEILKAIQ